MFCTSVILRFMCLSLMMVCVCVMQAMVPIYKVVEYGVSQVRAMRQSYTSELEYCPASPFITLPTTVPWQDAKMMLFGVGISATTMAVYNAPATFKKLFCGFASSALYSASLAYAFQNYTDNSDGAQLLMQLCLLTGNYLIARSLSVSPPIIDQK